jgi:hypothetical protein
MVQNQTKIATSHKLINKPITSYLNRPIIYYTRLVIYCPITTLLNSQNDNASLVTQQPVTITISTMLCQCNFYDIS